MAKQKSRAKLSVKLVYSSSPNASGRLRRVFEILLAPKEGKGKKEEPPAERDP